MFHAKWGYVCNVQGLVSIILTLDNNKLHGWTERAIEQLCCGFFFYSAKCCQLPSCVFDECGCDVIAWHSLCPPSLSFPLSDPSYGRKRCWLTKALLKDCLRLWSDSNHIFLLNAKTFFSHYRFWLSSFVLDLARQKENLWGPFSIPVLSISSFIQTRWNLLYSCFLSPW